MRQEVYRIVVTHYIEDDKGNKTKLEEPIVCQHICINNIGNPVILLNDMLDKIKNFVLEKAEQI
jgi:hypothetical protein